MLREQMSLRNFKGGSWDLRKDERRKTSLNIGFPDRRQSNDRRNATRADAKGSGEMLQWVSKSSLDE